MPMSISGHVPTVSFVLTTRELSVGSKGADVLKLQKALVAAGFATHGVDGKFGAQTKVAVMKFQKAHGLKVDGVAGHRTLAALNGGTVKPPVTTVPPKQVTTVGPSTPTGTASASIQEMLAWGKTKLGAPYAAVNPFRFGDIPWDGKVHTSENGSGRKYHIAKGKTVFDCSGFVVAMYRKAGVDLVAQGLASTQQFIGDTHFLQPLTKQNLKPGDLILYKPHKGIGHVVIYMGGDQCIESNSSKGVSINTVHWNNVKTYRRVPLPEQG